MLEEGKKPAIKHIRELRDGFKEADQHCRGKSEGIGIDEKQTWYQQNPQTGEWYELKDVHTPIISHEVELFIEEFVNTEPKRDRWANPLKFWWDQYENAFGTEDTSPAELLWGLQEIAGADVEYDEDHDGITVYGVAIQ